MLDNIILPKLLPSASTHTGVFRKLIVETCGNSDAITASTIVSSWHASLSSTGAANFKLSFLSNFKNHPRCFVRMDILILIIIDICELCVMMLVMSVVLTGFSQHFVRKFCSRTGDSVCSERVSGQSPTDFMSANSIFHWTA